MEFKAYLVLCWNSRLDKKSGGACVSLTGDKGEQMKGPERGRMWGGTGKGQKRLSLPLMLGIDAEDRIPKQIGEDRFGRKKGKGIVRRN